MKKIAAKRNYKLINKASELKPATVYSETNTNNLYDNLTDIEEKLNKVATKIDNLQRLTYDLASSVSKIHEWQEDLPDLKVLDNVWRSLHKNTGEV